MKNFVAYFLLSLFAVSALAQSSQMNVFKGNKAYRNEKYENASELYRQAIEKKSDYDFIARYNLGNSLYKSGDFEGARNSYAELIDDTLNNNIKSRLYHNIGNTFLKEKKYQESVGAYKNALKYNPNDEDTRYNLSYALQMLKQQQQQQQQNQQNQQNQDKNQDKNQQNQDKNKDNKQDDKKDDKQNKDNKQDQQKNDQQNQQNQINPSQAEQMLKALQNKEKQTQREINAKPVKKGQGAGETYKDW
ncbi:MAG: tetratricopeptide repeat protein [Bacteroidales bacterium]|jgi:tetratricopeptide (TPR) repeat protein|nr:tetratricopeptide repeat protein [Bacteroidales bacterium]